MLKAHLDEKPVHGASALLGCLFFCVQVGPTTARFSASHFEYRCCGVLWEDEQSNLFPSTSGILWYVEGAAVPKRTTSNQWRQSRMLLDLVVGGETEVVVDFLRRVSVWQQKRFRTWTLCHSLALVRDEYWLKNGKLHNYLETTKSLTVPSHREVLLLRHRTSSVIHLIRTRSNVGVCRDFIYHF